MPNQTVAQLARGLQEKEFSSSELTRDYLDRIKALDEKYNAFITVDEAAALAAATGGDLDRR